MKSVYRVAATHPLTPTEGGMYGPGDQVEGIDPLDPHNAALIALGHLVLKPRADKLTGEPLQSRARELDIDGRSDMTADQLREAIASAELDDQED